MIPLSLDRTGPLSLQEQLYRALRDGILSGRLAGGAALPATRDLASDLEVSRNTVLQAYDWLASEGLIEGRQGSGSYVAATGRTAELPVPWSGTAVPTDEAASRPDFDLWYGRPDHRNFPLGFWRRTAADLLTGPARGLADYGPPAGDPELRTEIARQLVATRGIAAGPERVIVTQGAHEAFHLIARLLGLAGAEMAFEAPGYAIAAEIFATAGAKLLAAPVDVDGVVPRGPWLASARALYLTPSHQFPTGATLSLERRRELVAWTRARDAWLIEDDYDGELIYDRPPLVALAAIDDARSLYVGSFSKVLGSGLRLGFLVAPAALAERAAHLKGLMSLGQSWLDQQILARFMASGRFDRHVRQLRKRLRERRDAAREALTEWLGEAAGLRPSYAGAHLYCDLDPSLSAAALAQAAGQRGVGLYAGRGAGIWSAADDPPNGLVVGYAGHTPGEIHAAFGRLDGLRQDPRR